MIESQTDNTPVQLWYVYMVRCQNDALYTGITNNLEERIKKHNSGKGSKSVRAHGLPVHIVYELEFQSKSEALVEECRIKKLTKSQKEKMILGKDG